MAGLSLADDRFSFGVFIQCIFQLIEKLFLHLVRKVSE